MKRHYPTTNENPAPNQINTPLRRRDLTDPEKLILVAQRHFANRFPNESRVGCPMPGVIQAARHDLPPVDELRDHLFQCSECFNEYRETMRDHYQRRTASNTVALDRRTKVISLLSRWRNPALAGATAIVLLAAGLSYWRRDQTAPLQSSVDRPQRAPVASAGNPLTPRPPAQPAGQTAKPVREKPRLAKNLAINLNLDLNQRSALGDNNRGGLRRDPDPTIKLPPRVTRLRLRLRDGSEAGLYQITVVDPHSAPLTSTTAHSRDGSSVEAVLDLRNAFEVAHRLRIERGDDMNEYLIEIEKP
jgi:hypothetical protein